MAEQCYFCGCELECAEVKVLVNGEEEAACEACVENRIEDGDAELEEE